MDVTSLTKICVTISHIYKLNNAIAVDEQISEVVNALKVAFIYLRKSLFNIVNGISLINESLLFKLLLSACSL